MAPEKQETESPPTPLPASEFKTQSDTISKIALALSKAQAKITAAKRTAENPFFGSKYADLNSVWESLRAPLSEHELAVVQTPIEDEHGTAIITTLAHSSGEWFRSKLYITPKAKDAQSVGSAITYARRYALSAITGAAPDDDDDGNGAAGHNGNGAAKTTAPRTPPLENMARKRAQLPPPTTPPKGASEGAPAPRTKVQQKTVYAFLRDVTQQKAKKEGAQDYFFLNGTSGGERWTTFSKSVAEKAKELATQKCQVAITLDMYERGPLVAMIAQA